ncbi:MAG: hypothetical protein COU35_03030 [Candidatus Magasanikbacteria bacterium CG10_big_fil_rev_8_21_14_0_10_47_10]|uniref:Uncharacterized protein n=1 Tax=Candidatus Magasanikbacteria bacterium CG10_big_fil_rev_8_21_14_0_10_47_10 TaxID=1974652 RepID=A0A2H0TSM1_9BACT|nr:MAG: hypothetical protein COU35_03030 [Candidatus Magasanikbacteria bacterium CG10_big_fil_rev_8_21_14_0_10_47_10]
MVIATLLCWSAWAVVLTNVDPFRDNVTGFILFYVTLFFSLIGTASLVTFLCLYYFSRAKYAVFYDVQRSFLVGLLVSSLATLLLFLQGRGVLGIWNILLFLCIIIFLILFKVSTTSYKKGA